MHREEMGPSNVECHLATKRHALLIYVTKSMMTLKNKTACYQRRKHGEFIFAKYPKKINPQRQGKGCGCLRLEVGIICDDKER